MSGAPLEDRTAHSTPPSVSQQIEATARPSSQGLFLDTPPPSREQLLNWLDQNGAYIHPALRVADMEDETGWRVISDEALEEFDLLFSIPKTALLSTRTSSLPPLPSTSEGPITNLSIFHLALCILHEMRLGPRSPFYGYLQSLPREPKECLLPMFWHLSELGGEDGKQGLRWLKGSEVERRMESKADEGLGYDDLVKFHNATVNHLPPTPSHPSPSPLTALIHTYTLILTRAFVIDLYRPTALVPFADLLNHSSTPHTSLASDEFVCHRCGSMGRCTHDMLDNYGLPLRLLGTDLIVPQKHKMAGMKAQEDDTVEMRADREVEAGHEVWNTYGEIGDAGLLAEWGFLGGEYAGEGLIWGVEEIPEGEADGALERWIRMMDGGMVVETDDMPGEEEDDGQGLISPPAKHGVNALLNLSLSGQLSFSLFLLIYLGAAHVGSSDSDQTVFEGAKGVADELERAYAKVESELSEQGEDVLAPTSRTATSTLSANATPCVRSVLDLLRRRLQAMYQPGLTPDQILQQRDDLPASNRYTRMAMTLTADERSLLLTTIRRWEDLLGA